MSNSNTKLLSINADAKTKRGVKFGYLTAIQYLSPANESGVANLCSDSTPGCKASCLYTAGRAAIHESINQSRIMRTIMFVRDKANYWPQLIREVEALIRKAAREQLIPCARLNGTSDVPWERMRIRGTGTHYDGMTILEAFPTVQFYDYTKTLDRINFVASIDNYYLLASYSEKMTDAMLNLQLAMGHNVAVVFRVCEHRATCKCELPTTWRGHRVIKGDTSDVRFDDDQGVIVGLKAKGDAREDYTGFVIRIAA
jgi:hypothetical protein